MLSMNKINNKKIFLGLKILSILAFSLLIIPTQTFATAGYVDNPTPYIASISPNSSNRNVGKNIVITITGEGFIPSSVARVNGSDRATTFIDYSHLLIRLNQNDTYNTNTDGFYINVFNGFPGGGYSNAILFTINSIAPVTNTVANTNDADSTSVNTNSTENTTNTDNNTDKNSSNLAATAILGSANSFLPSGLIQWVFFAIIILVIVIFVRRIFGAKKNYEETPLKHA